MKNKKKREKNLQVCLKKKFLPVVVVVYDDARLIFWIKNCLES
jgi:hypothetical protein